MLTKLNLWLEELRFVLLIAVNLHFVLEKISNFNLLCFHMSSSETGNYDFYIFKKGMLAILLQNKILADIILAIQLLENRAMNR